MQSSDETTDHPTGQLSEPTTQGRQLNRAIREGDRDKGPAGTTVIQVTASTPEAAASEERPPDLHSPGETDVTKVDQPGLRTNK